MEKSYCDFIDEISEDELYEGLLSYGFFTDKHPPVFRADSFYDYYKNSNLVFNSDSLYGSSHKAVIRNIRNAFLSFS